LGKAEVWKRVQSIVGSKIHSQSYATWIAPTRLADLNEDTITIEGPNQFFADWLTHHHLDTLLDAVQETIGYRPDVEFTFREDSGERESRLDASRKDMFLRRYTHDPRASKVLNQRYSFDNFIVGGSNRMAHAASRAVAESLARIYNPLFIYGGVGLGKTHLAQAIGHAVLTEDPKRRVHYASSESFMNELIFAIRRGTTLEFKDKYRSTDLLIIDDIQFLAGRESTQEEFFHTFNALYDNNKQIVVTSDRPPKDIKELEERLISRFEWGLIADIQRPDLETRIAILRNKADKDKLSIPEPVLTLIAENVKHSIRELEGSLIRLLAFSNLTGHPINEDLVKETLHEYVRNPAREISLSEIQKQVGKRYGITVEQMKSEKRSSKIVFPRQVAIYLSRELTGESLVNIGRSFGGRDHTTIIHACRKIDQSLKSDPDLFRDLNELKQGFRRLG
jgi:chromosomal replication initiator protein